MIRLMRKHMTASLLLRTQHRFYSKGRQLGWRRPKRRRHGVTVDVTVDPRRPGRFAQLGRDDFLAEGGISKVTL